MLNSGFRVAKVTFQLILGKLCEVKIEIDITIIIDTIPHLLRHKFFGMSSNWNGILCPRLGAE